MKNLAEMLRITSQEFPDREAVVYGNLRLTWGDIYLSAALIRTRLLSQGIGRGDVVAIYAEHSPAQIAAIFGILMADAAFTILSPSHKDNQVKHQLTDSNARAVIGTRNFLEAIKTLSGDRGLNMLEVGLAGNLVGIDPNSFHQYDLGDTYSINIPSDVGCIIYTSGSTGRAKGVVVPQRTMIDGAKVVSEILKITKDDVILSLLPFNFDYGLNQLLTIVLQGGKIVLHNFTFPQDLIDDIERENITGMAAVPSLWPLVLNERLVKPDPKRRFPSLRYITTAGGFHTRDLLKAISEFFIDSEIIIFYGLTESFRSSCLPYSEIFKRQGSIGKAVPGVELLVWNEDGLPCKVGERGELIHRGLFVTYGYLNNPELNVQKFIRLTTGGPGCLPEVAVRSGDLVSLDNDGYIYYHGRIDSQMKCNGYRVSPSEIEEVVLMFHDISHAAAFGLPDAKIGEAVHVAYATYSGKEVNSKEMLIFLTKQLPSYAVPKKVFHYAHLPLTGNGKIDYPSLKINAEEMGDG